MKQYKNTVNTIHILPKHPQNCQSTHTLKNPYIHKPTHTHNHILQNKLKPPQFKIHTK